MGGQNGALGTGAAAIVADAWILSHLGEATREWSRLSWKGVYPLQRCRHSLAVVGDLAIVYGGYDGSRTLDAHHSLFCAPLRREADAEASENDGGTAAAAVWPVNGRQATTSGGDDEAALAAARRAELRRRQQERWAAEQPVTEANLSAEEHERAD